MKEWKISFVNKDGVLDSLKVSRPDCPSIEDAAELVRSHLYPVAAALDPHDFENRAASPIAKNLKEQNSVEIRAVTEVS